MAINVEDIDQNCCFYKSVSSAMEVSWDHSNELCFDDVFGVDKTISMLKEYIVLPLRFPNLFRQRRIHNRGIMLFGIPGCGKTHLLIATANASGDNLFVFNCWNLQSRYFRNSMSIDQCVKTVFKVACDNSPSILCFEDIEVLSRTSDDSKTEKVAFLNELHNLFENKSDKAKNVIVLGVTQKPWEVDPYVRRMFLRGHGSHVVLPNEEARLSLLKALCNKLEGSHSLRQDDLEALASKTHGFTGSDLKCLVRSATMQQIRKIGKATHFKQVLIPADGNAASDTREGRARAVSSEGANSSGRLNPESKRCEHEKQVSKLCCDTYEEDVERAERSGNEPKKGENAGIESVEKTLEGRTDDSFSIKIFDDGNCNPVVEKAEIVKENVLLCSDVLDSTRQLESVTDTVSETGNDSCQNKFVPCEADDTGAIPMTVFDIPDEKLHVCELTKHDMDDALCDMKGSLHEEDLQKMLLFESQFCP